jgi:acyl-CoA thioesterase FadM
MWAMTREVLTTWGVVLDVEDEDEGEPAVDEAALHRRAAAWFETGRRAYFDRCPRLHAVLDEEDAVLAISGERIDPLLPTPRGGGVRIAVSVTEVRPSSFDMALRIRRSTSAETSPANGRCTVTIERRATGEPILVPRDVRDEMIAIQRGARTLG